MRSENRMTKPITRKTVLTLASLALVGVGGVLVLRPLARDGGATAEVQASSDAGPVFGKRAELSRGGNSAEGPCTFALRSRMAYQVTTKSTSKMDMGPLLSEIEIQGGTVSAQATASEQTASRDWRLELEALARATDGSTVVAARIDAAPTQVAGRSAASAGFGLDSTFLIRVNAQCNVQDFGRRTDGERPVAQDQQQLVAGLSYLAPAGGEDGYQGTSLDSLGRYFATYSVQDGGLLRGRALEYRETFGQVVGGMAPKFEIGESSIEVQPQEGEWFSQLNHRREVDISMAGHSIGTVRSTVVGKRVAPAGRIEAVDLHDGGWSWGILLGQPTTNNDSHAAPESAQVGVPMREALAEYLAQTAASGSSLDAVPLLVEWLQANPEGAADIVDQLRSGGPSRLAREFGIGDRQAVGQTTKFGKQALVAVGAARGPGILVAAKARLATTG